MSAKPTCQGCGAVLELTWIDLGLSPLANSNVPPEMSDVPDPVYPLHARVCERCLLVQVDPVVRADEIFNDRYAYFSSYSDSWLRHCADYAAAMIARFGLTSRHQIIEIASNDGYLLQYFQQRGIPVLGIEPSANTAEAAIAKGIPTEVRFFGVDTARDLAARGCLADLLVAKNVMAHVPDINDFVGGVALVLKPEGVFTVEFPHLLNTSRSVQFDTIYHEHYTYLSLLAVETIFARSGLRAFDVEQHPTHGGSLRVFACLADAAHQATERVEAIRALERSAGLDRRDGYLGFEKRVRKVKDDLIAFLALAQARGERVAGYGAAAKGNTLINYCGLGPRDLPMIADRSAAKQGMLAPGSHIPIVSPEALLEWRPDHVLILPWNIADEVKEQLREVRDYGGRFVTAIPELVID